MVSVVNKKSVGDSDDKGVDMICLKTKKICLRVKTESDFRKDVLKLAKDKGFSVEIGTIKKLSSFGSRLLVIVMSVAFIGVLV